MAHKVVVHFPLFRLKTSKNLFIPTQGKSSISIVQCVLEETNLSDLMGAEREWAVEWEYRVEVKCAVEYAAEKGESCL